MSTQTFYEDYIKKHFSSSPHLMNERVIYTIAEMSDGKHWDFMPNKYYSEKDARTIARFQSTTTEGLWRVATGEHIVALYLNGEEIKEE